MMTKRTRFMRRGLNRRIFSDWMPLLRIHPGVASSLTVRPFRWFFRACEAAISQFISGQYGYANGAHAGWSLSVLGNRVP